MLGVPSGRPPRRPRRRSRWCSSGDSVAVCRSGGAEVSPRLWRRIERRIEVDPSSGCWLCSLALQGGGYCQIDAGGGRIGLVHRVSYVWHKGPIPAGAKVLHTCDVRRCCNPDHLWLGSDADNSRDACMKGRRARKLTPDDVSCIRVMPGPQVAIGHRFGVSRSLVSMIRTGATWRHHR